MDGTGETARDADARKLARPRDRGRREPALTCWSVSAPGDDPEERAIPASLPVRRNFPGPILCASVCRGNSGGPISLAISPLARADQAGSRTGRRGVAAKQCELIVRDDAQLELKIGAMRPNHGLVMQAIFLVLPEFAQPGHREEWRIK